MSSNSDRIREKLRAAAYHEAFLIGRMALEESPCDYEVIAALHDLTAQLRSNCMDLAVRKMDVGPAYATLENVLSEANKLTGQDMYGRNIISSPSQ